MHQLLPAAGEVDLFSAYAQREHTLRVNFVASIDGAATIDGRSDPLSSPADKKLFGVLRALSEVVLVGAGTVRVEKYGPIRLTPELRAWREARGMPAVPALAVASSSLDLDPAGALFTEALVRPIVLTGAGAPAERRAALSEVADVVTGSLAGWLEHLAGQGLNRVLCEGGPTLFGSLLAGGHVDEVCLTRSPLVAAQPSMGIASMPATAAPRRFDLVHVLEEDGHLFLRYSASAAS
ncbi:MAG: pyrimidine reductase family protein [Mycobacteriales bacterium]